MSNPYPLRYINLSKDTARRDHMEAELQKAHVDGVRLDAVWWKTLTDAEQAKYYSEKKNRQQYYQALVNGEKGCYASHICAWQALLDSNAPGMIVLEDDVTLHANFSSVVEAIALLPTNWDMIKLLSRPVEKIRATRPLIPGHQLIQYRRVPSWTAGYVISRSGARKLLESRLPFGRPVDVDIRFWFENDLHVFGVYPSLLALDELSDTSSIWAQRDQLTLSQRLRKFAMKARLTLGNALAKQPELP